MNMDELVAQLDSILESWESTYERLLPLETTWQPYLPRANLESVNEAVHTATDNLRRLRSPNGLTPVFHLAKAAAVPIVTSMLATVRALQAGQYNQLPTFVAGLLQLINVMHTLTIFSQRNPDDTLTANLNVEQAQAIALLGTAERRLANKIAMLAGADETAAAVETASAKADQLAIQVNDAVNAAETNLSELADILEASKKAEAQISEQAKRLPN